MINGQRELNCGVIIPEFENIFPNIEIFNSRDVERFKALYDASWKVASDIEKEDISLENPHHGTIHFHQTMDATIIIAPIALGQGIITPLSFCLLPAIMGGHDAGFKDEDRKDKKDNFTDKNEKRSIAITLEKMRGLDIFTDFELAIVSSGIDSTVVVGVDEHGVVQKGSKELGRQKCKIGLRGLVPDIDVSWNGRPYDEASPQVDSLFVEQSGEEPVMTNPNYRNFRKFGAKVMGNHIFNFDFVKLKFPHNIINAERINSEIEEYEKQT